MAVGDVVAGEAVYPDHPVGAQHGQQRRLNLCLIGPRVSIAIDPTTPGCEHRSRSVDLDRAAFAGEPRLEQLDPEVVRNEAGQLCIASMALLGAPTIERRVASGQSG